MAAVLGAFLRSMAEQLPCLPDDAASSVSETVMGLLTATLSRRQLEADERATLPEVLKARVRQYVQTHLTDPSLDIARIAAAMRCSKRHLHRAFGDESQTLDRYIWRSRLTLARQRLLADEPQPVAIGVLATACGFRNSAHFCRLFKQEYGVAPREARHSGSNGVTRP